MTHKAEPPIVCRQKRDFLSPTNGYWAKTREDADRIVSELTANGLSQLRLSYSRWHKAHIRRENIVHAALGCQRHGLDYFISFVTDFSKEDDPFEQFLRDHQLKFFPELDMFACCDGVNRFSKTGFLYLGNLGNDNIDTLFRKMETHRLYHLIRTMGLTSMASFLGLKAREIVHYRKYELCEKLFNSEKNLSILLASATSDLINWRR